MNDLLSVPHAALSVHVSDTHAHSHSWVRVTGPGDFHDTLFLACQHTAHFSCQRRAQSTLLYMNQYARALSMFDNTVKDVS